MLKGLSRGAAPRAGGGSVPVVPGRMGREVALARPHLMEVASKEFGKTHNGVRGKRGEVRIVRRRVGKRGPIQEENCPRFLLQGDI